MKDRITRTKHTNILKLCLDIVVLFIFFFSDHYGSVADKFDYFFQEFHEANIPILIECLDLQPHHIIADIGSGTGIIAEKLYEKCGLTKPIWCVDPSVEMQEKAWKREGTYPVLKTAEEFFSHPEIAHCFDRVISIGAAHHFADPVAVYKSIFHSLRPGGIFIEVTTMDTGYPCFKSAKRVEKAAVEIGIQKRKLIRKLVADPNVRVSEKEYCCPMSLTKSKLYEMYRRRYMSMLHQLNDEQIAEGIRELEDGPLTDVKSHDHISFTQVIHVTKFDLN